MVCSLHSVTTGSRDRANVSLIIIYIIIIIMQGNGLTTIFAYRYLLFDHIFIVENPNLGCNKDKPHGIHITTRQVRSATNIDNLSYKGTHKH